MSVRISMMMGCLLWVAAGIASGEPCRVKDFRGSYAFQGVGTDIRNPAAPVPMALSGVLRADGRGGFVYWHNVVSFIPPGGGPKTVIRSDLVDDANKAGSSLRYEVRSDCRMRIFGTLQTPFGPSPLEIEGGLARGGRKALLQMGAPFAIGSWTAEKARGSRTDEND